MPKTSSKVTQATKPKVSSAVADNKAKTDKKPKKEKKTGKAVVGKAKTKPTPTIKKKKQLAKRDNPIYEKRTRNFGIGNNIPPKRDLTRFVKWPKYIRLQRQKRILFQRLKIPGPINQFNLTADKNTTQTLFKLLAQYRPETRAQKKARLLAEAKEIVGEQKAEKAEGEKTEEKTEEKKTVATKTKKQHKKPKFVKYGLKHVTALVESRKARLVIIANDVDPLELVLWLPTLCKKKDIPFIIVKGKASLGRIVHKKTSAVAAITEVEKAHEKDLEVLIQKARENFIDRYSDNMKRTGGQIMGHKHNQAKVKQDRIRAKELSSVKKV